MKSILIVASVASMIDQFLMPYIEEYSRRNIRVVVATNFANPGTISVERSNEVVKQLRSFSVEVEQVDFARSPLSTANLTAYQQLLKIMSNERFDVIHSHSPIGGLLTRLAAKNQKSQKNAKVVYTAHGFHFFKGAPIQNWLIYYPIEKYMSGYTDALITMNEEDYQLAKAKFKLRTPDSIYKINGVGVDIGEYSCSIAIDYNFKASLGIPKENFVITIIGELNKNKNQIQMLQAIERLNDSTITLVLVGTGANYELFKKKYQDNSNIKILGYRTDVKSILNITDVVASMSYREGLPKNLMEAMAAGKPIIVTNIRGNKDLIENNINGYTIPVDDIDSTMNVITILKASGERGAKIRTNNIEKIKQYSFQNVSKQIDRIYQIVLKERNRDNE